MRTSFEFQIVATNTTEAEAIALKKVSTFLEIPEEEVTDKVGLELRVSYPEAKTLIDIAKNEDQSSFVVTVYGTVKQSVSKHFGL